MRMRLGSVTSTTSENPPNLLGSTRRAEIAPTQTPCIFPHSKPFFFPKGKAFQIHPMTSVSDRSVHPTHACACVCTCVCVRACPCVRVRACIGACANVHACVRPCACAPTYVHRRASGWAYVTYSVLKN